MDFTRFERCDDTGARAFVLGLTDDGRWFAGHIAPWDGLLCGRADLERGCGFLVPDVGPSTTPSELEAAVRRTWRRQETASPTALRAAWRRRS